MIQPESPKPLKQIMARLESLSEPVSRTKRIENLINQLAYNSPPQDCLPKSVLDYLKNPQQKKLLDQSEKKEIEDYLTAFLFSQTRRLYQEEGKTHFDFDKEKRQIKAVVKALEGHHIHMGTGEGKSSVVIPIVALVETLVSNKHDVVVSTTTNTLLEEIKQKTQTLSKTLGLLIPEKKIDLYLPKKNEFIDPVDDQLFIRMQKEALLNGEYSPETRKKLTQRYWAQQLALSSSSNNDLFPKKDPNQPRIIFVNERELVFEASEDPEKFVAICPKILMDEVDVAWNRQSPYVRTKKDRLVIPTEIQASTYTWLFNHIVGHQLTEADFEWFQGQRLAKKEVIKKLNLEINEENSFFNNGLAIIAKKLGLNQAEIKQLKNKFIVHFQKPEIKKGLKTWALGIADIWAQISHSKNRHYIFDKNGYPIIRDPYVDELLEEHRYNPEEQIAVLAMADKFDFVHFNSAITSAVRFPTFISWVGDKIIGFSGTLLYPHLTKPTIQQSSLAKFLKDFTKRSVELITPPEKKTTPIPYWFLTNQEAEEKLLEEFEKPTQPILLLDHLSVDHAENIAKKIKEKGLRIAFLPPKPSEPEQEKEYNDYLKKISSQLANKKIDVIVSSGAAGIGVNIVKTDGSFPDLRVIHFGMPEDEMLIPQGNGRRRAPGNNFSWYLSEESLKPWISYFSEELADKLSIALGEIDQLKIHQLIKEARQSPEKRLPVILKIFSQKKRKEAIDTLKSIQYDNFFHQVFAPQFSKKLEERLAKLWQAKKKILEERYPIIDENKDKQGTKLFNQLVREYTQAIGLPNSLYYQAQLEASLSSEPEATSKNNAYGEIHLPHVLLLPKLGKKQSFLDKWLNIWWQDNIEKIRLLEEITLFNQSEKPAFSPVVIMEITQQIFEQFNAQVEIKEFPQMLTNQKNFPDLPKPITIIITEADGQKTELAGIEQDGKYYLLYCPSLDEEKKLILLPISTLNLQSFSILPLEPESNQEAPHYLCFFYREK